MGERALGTGGGELSSGWAMLRFLRVRPQKFSSNPFIPTDDLVTREERDAAILWWVPTVSSSWCSLLSSRMWAPEGHDERIITYSDSKLNGFENFLFLQLIIIKKN